jgi:hypothetical protein
MMKLVLYCSSLQGRRHKFKTDKTSLPPTLPPPTLPPPTLTLTPTLPEAHISTRSKQEIVSVLRMMAALA